MIRVLAAQDLHRVVEEGVKHGKRMPATVTKPPFYKHASHL